MKHVKVLRLKDKSVLGIAEHEERTKERYKDVPFLMLHTVIMLPGNVLQLPVAEIPTLVAATPGASTIYDLATKDFCISVFGPGEEYFIDWISIETEASYDGDPSPRDRQILKHNVESSVNRRVQAFAGMFSPFLNRIVSPEIHIAREQLVWDGEKKCVGRTSVTLMARLSATADLGSHKQFELVREGSFRRVASYVNSTSLAKARAFEKWEERINNDHT